MSKPGGTATVAGDAPTVEGFARFGPDFLGRLNGMFALAVYDRKTRTLVLARDQIGIKPLYVKEAGGGILFASEAKFFSHTGRFTPRIRAAGLSAFLRYGHCYGDRHVLDGVRIHTVTPEDAGIKVQNTSIIDGVRVVTLKDLVAIKLLCGLKNPGRSKDIGDVEDLIRSIPLDKRFAMKLPKGVRQEFKALVDAVRARDRAISDDRRF